MQLYIFYIDVVYAEILYTDILYADILYAYTCMYNVLRCVVHNIVWTLWASPERSSKNSALSRTKQNKGVICLHAVQDTAGPNHTPSPPSTQPTAQNCAPTASKPLSHCSYIMAMPPLCNVIVALTAFFCFCFETPLLSLQPFCFETPLLPSNLFCFETPLLSLQPLFFEKSFLP